MTKTQKKWMAGALMAPLLCAIIFMFVRIFLYMLKVEPTLAILVVFALLFAIGVGMLGTIDSEQDDSR